MADLGTTTATILFTDVVGSTELRRRLGESAADRVFIEHRRRARHGDRPPRRAMVKYTGDGVMASFASASTRCTRPSRSRTTSPSTAASLAVRVGVAAGDVTWEGDDCFGLPVVAAARLEAAAEGGQILVTEIVRLLAGDRAGDRYEPLGPLELKGLPIRWRPTPSSGTAGAGGGRRRAGRRGRRSAGARRLRPPPASSAATTRRRRPPAGVGRRPPGPGADRAHRR